MTESNTDKRTVFTDALETLGTLIDSNQKRDAIHLAVIPVMAKSSLNPGDNVTANGEIEGEFVGIVDPFLKDPIEPGQWFWLVIYPRKITSLRHVWEHPDIPDEIKEEISSIEVEKSKKWIEDYAASFIDEYEDGLSITGIGLILGASNYLQHGDSLSKGSLFEGHSVSDEFWDHYEIVTGKKVKIENRQDFFSCSC